MNSKVLNNWKIIIIRLHEVVIKQNQILKFDYGPEPEPEPEPEPDIEPEYEIEMEQDSFNKGICMIIFNDDDMIY